MERTWVRVASIVQVWAEGQSEVPERARGRMRAIASENHSTQARRLLDVRFWINTPFPKPARWKRRVPGALAPKFSAPSPTRKDAEVWQGI